MNYQGQWAILIKNSWGEGWGDQGFGILTESQITESIVYHGAFYVVSTTIPDDEAIHLVTP